MTKPSRRRGNKRRNALLALGGVAVSIAVLDRLVLAPGAASASTVSPSLNAQGTVQRVASNLSERVRSANQNLSEARQLAELFDALSSGASQDDLTRLSLALAGPDTAAAPVADPSLEAQTPFSTSQSDQVLSERSPRVSAVLSGPNAAAIIDGSLLSVGDSIGDLTLIEVNGRRATVRLGGELLVLTMD